VGKRIQLGLLLAPFSAALIGLGALFTLTSPGAPLAAGEEEAGDPVTLCRDDDAKVVPCAALVEMEIRDVVPLEEAGTHAVVLVSKDRGTVLPIFVEPADAAAIAFRLAKRTAPAPQAQDLIDQLVAKMGGEVTEVRIEGIDEEQVTSHVVVQRGEERMEFAARPSDSIAMAMNGKAKIFATRKMLTQAGITQEQIDALQNGEMPTDPHHLLPDEGEGLGGSGLEDEPEDPNEIRL
jgi:bifunctional DNase/RNase